MQRAYILRLSCIESMTKAPFVGASSSVCFRKLSSFWT